MAKTAGKILFGTIALLLVIYVAFVAVVELTVDHPFFEEGGPLVMVHQGEK